MAIPVNAVVRLSIRAILFGQRVINHFDYRIVSTASSNTDEVDQKAIADAWVADAILIAWRAWHSDAMSIEVIRAQVLAPYRNPYTEVSIMLDGQNAGTCESANIGAVITKVGQFPGRKFVSTTHLAGITDTSMEEGYVSPAGWSLLAAIAARLNVQISTAAPVIVIQPVIYHGFTAVPLSDDIVTTRRGSTIRTMRRRGVGLGQ